MKTTMRALHTQLPLPVAPSTLRDSEAGRAYVLTDDPLPAFVRGVDVDGERFTQEGVIDIFSSSSFKLRLPRRLYEGRRVFVVILIDRVLVALRGTIGDTKPAPDDSYTSAIAIIHYRFLPVTPDGSSPEWLSRMLGRERE